MAQLQSPPPTIYEFQGDYRFLSNFYPAPIVVDGITYDTTEHFYQMHKFTQKWLLADIRTAPTPGQAKRIARQYSVLIREDWDEIKVRIMTIATMNKFWQHTALAVKLLQTGNAVLIEGNRWHDNFWGSCQCDKCTQIIGQNQLGLILRNVRNTLR